MYVFLKKYYAHFLYTILTIGTILLTFQNIPKGIFLILLFTIWYIFTLKKPKSLTTLPFLLSVVPFNITLQIPFFNTEPFVAGFWVNYLIPTISILDIFAILLLIQLCFLLKKEVIKKYLKDKYLLILLLFFIIHTLITQNLLSTLLYTRIFLYLITFLLLLSYLKKTEYIKKVAKERWVFFLLLSSVLIQGVIGIYQFLKGASLGVFFLGESKLVSGMGDTSFIDINGQLYLRAYGTFPHPNILAGWYLFIFLLSFALYKESKKKIYLFLILLTSILLLLTFSRVSILLLLLILTIFFVGKKVFSFSSLLYFRFMNIFSSMDSSFSDRVKLIELNFKIFKENILLGTGLGNSLYFYKENIPFTQGGRLLLQPVHNIWVLNFVELGLFLGIYYLYILFRYFLRGVKMNRFTVSILLFLVIVGMFDHYFFTLPQGNVIFFLSLVLISTSKLLLKRKST
ncbi:MAG: hypothetical protein ACOX0X_01710 [Candidatus Dojkabacteria bacterium]